MREGQFQYQKSEWSQKGTQKGFAFHKRETKLVCSIIRGKENGSITDYFPLLPTSKNITTTSNLAAANACPMC